MTWSIVGTPVLISRAHSLRRTLALRLAKYAGPLIEYQCHKFEDLMKLPILLCVKCESTR